MATEIINFQPRYAQPFVQGTKQLRTIDTTGAPIVSNYRIRIDWTPRRVGSEGLDRQGREVGNFTMTWSDAIGTVLLSGERLRLGTDLLRRFKYDRRLPQGSLNCVASAEPETETTRGTEGATGTEGGDLGIRVRLEYVEP